MKKPIKRLFEPANKSLMSESERYSEKQKKLWKEMSIAGANKIIPLLDKAHRDYRTTKKSEPSQYKIIEEAIDFCQDSLWRDKAGMDLVIPKLIKVYGGLIEKIIKSFCSKRGILNEIEDWRTIAHVCFYRLISGDLPETIKAFENEKNIKHNLSLMTNLFNHRLYKIKKAKREEFNAKIAMLEETRVHPDDIDIAKKLFAEEIENFSQWINNKEYLLNFDNWVVNQLDYTLNVFRQGLKATRNPEYKKWYPQQIKVISGILKDHVALDSYKDKYQVQLKQNYEKYVENAYSDHRYDKNEWHNFTVFTKTTLPSALNDIYKSSAYKNSKSHKNTDSLDEVEDTDLYQPSTLDRASLKNELAIDSESLDFSFFLKRLPSRQRQVALLLSQRYKKSEIAQKLKISRPAVTALANKIKIKAKKFGLAD